jgi:hypothetical protein
VRPNPTLTPLVKNVAHGAITSIEQAPRTCMLAF